MPTKNLKVEYVPAEQLKLNPQNPRLNDENIEALVKSIEAFGWTNPILARRQNNMVIAGHTRLKAARQKGIDKVPVIFLELDESNANVYMIADNKLTMNVEWDLPKLADLFVDFDQLNVDMDLTGFSETEIENIVVPEPNPQDDIIPEPPKEPITKIGDLWLLGKHRLLCGDSTKKEDVERLMDGNKPHLMVTDPPYGVNYKPEWRNQAQISKTKQVGKIQNDNRSSWASVFSKCPCTIAYVWHAGKYAGDVERALIISGFEIRSQIIWVKKRFALSRGHYHWRHEPLFYAVKKGEDAHWVGGRKQGTIWADIVDAFPLVDYLFASKIDSNTLYIFEGSMSTVWEIEHNKACEGGHPTQKPVECMVRPIRNNSKIKDSVYDPFLGSGSTLIACEKLNRICYGMEIDPIYCDVIVKRWENYTDGKAKLIDK